MATITSLGFSIFSTYSGRGVTAARRDISDLSNDLDKNKAKLASSAQSFFSLSTAALSLAPALAPLTTVLAGVGAATVAMTATAGIALGGYGLLMDKAIQNTLKMAKAHKDLTPVQQAFVSEVNKMKAAMNGVSTNTMSLTLKTATVFVQGITAAIQHFTPVIRAVHPLILAVATAFRNWATGSGMDRFISLILRQGVPALQAMLNAGRNMLAVLGSGMRAFAPLGVQVAQALERGSAAMKTWAATGGFERFISNVRANGPAVGQFFKALGEALRNISIAMAGLGPVSLGLATTLLRLVAALPPSWIQAIVVGFVAFRAVMLGMAIVQTVITLFGALHLVLVTLNFVLIALGITWTTFFWWITLIVAAVAALVFGIIMLVKHWTAVWNAIKAVAVAVWNFLKSGWGQLILSITFMMPWLIFATHWREIWNVIKTVAHAIWTGLQVAWTAFVNAMTAVWRAVSPILVAAWNAVWNAMKVVAQAIWAAMQVAWSAFINAMAVVWRTVSAALSAAWSATWNAMKVVAQAIWTAMQAAWNAWIAAMKAITNAFLTVMKAIWSAAWNVMKTVGIAIWNAMRAAWNAFVAAFKAVMNAFLTVLKAVWSAAWNAMKTAGIAIWNAMRAAWNAFVSAFKAVMNAFLSVLKTVWSAGWNAIKTVFQTIINAIKAAWDAFSSAFRAAVSATVGAVKTAWNAIKDAFQAPIRFVIDVVINKGIIGAVNWVLDKLGAGKNTIPTVPLPFAKGGFVSGPGTGTSDSIPAVLSNGEYVLKASAVKSIGVDKLNAMNGGVTPLSAEEANRLGLSPQMVAASQNGGIPAGAFTGQFADGGGDINFGDVFGGFEAIAKGILGIIGGVVGSAVDKGSKVVGGIVGAIGGLFGHPHAGDSIKNGGASAADAIKGWSHEQFAGALDKLIGLLGGKMQGLIGNGVVGGIGGGAAVTMGKGVLSFVKNKVVDFLFKEQKKKIDEAKAAQAAGSPTGATTKSVQAWATLARQAMIMGGLNPAQLGKFLALMQAESGGNPNAINRTDSNAKKGTPSIGLMQVIGPTFSAYHVAGTSGNIYDPLANMAASANYIKHRYGGNVPGSPYYSGTNSAQPGWHMFGEHGPELAFANGGEKVLSATQTRRRLSASGGGESIVFADGAFTFNFNGGVTKEAIQHIESDLVPKLRMAVQAGVGKRS